MSLTFARRRQSEAKKREKRDAQRNAKGETAKEISAKGFGNKVDASGPRKKTESSKKTTQTSLHEQKD